MKKKFLLPLLVFATLLCHAQPWYTTFAPHGRDVSASAMVRPEKIILGSGFDIADQFEEFFLSTDYGLGWNVNSTNANTSMVMSVAFADSMTGYGVCRHGKIVRTLDGGNTWSNVDSLHNRDFFKLVYANAQTLYVVGGSRADDTATILKSTNGGQNWTVIYDQPGSKLRSVYFFDAANGIAVGDHAQILTTTNGGSLWVPVSSPVVGRDFNDIEFADANTGFIVGGIADSMQTILKTTNGGLNWSIITDTDGGFLRDIEFVDGTIGYLVGDSATALKTTNGGLNWAVEPLPNLNPDQRIYTISFYDTAFGVMAGKDGYVWLYANTTAPEALTIGSMPIDTNNITLIGRAHTHGIPAICEFAVSTNSSMPFMQTQFWNGGNGPVTTNSFTLFSGNVNNLSPDTTYYFYYKVTSIAGISRGDTLSFTPAYPTYIFQTNNPQNVTDTTADFSGYVNRLHDTLNISFDYGTTMAMQSNIAGIPAVVNDTLPHNITATATSLQPHTQYYCRMKGTDANHTYLGYPFSFFTGNPYTLLQTLQVSNLTNNSVTLNGAIQGATTGLNLYFEYGFSPNMNNTVIAVPATVSDTMYHTVSAQVNTLAPDMLYYYRLRAQVNNAVFYSNTLSFFTGNPNFLFETLQATDVSGTTATLNGEADHLSLPANIWFEYGTTFGLGQTATAQPSNISDTLYHSISSFLTGLAPFTQYFYRLVGQSTSGMYYGTIQGFQTGSAASNFQGTGATNVTANSARLNGKVHYLTGSYGMGFEYGTDTLSFASTGAIPGAINDTGLYNVFVQVTGLQANTVYYYRMKGVSGSNTRYSDWVPFYTGNEIPNWDFQYWTHDTATLPVDWNFFGKDFTRVPGHSGNYGVYIPGNNVSFKGIVGDKFSGGQAFNARPDSLSVYLQHSIVPGDSAGILVYLYNSNGTVAQNIFMVSGSTSGSYQHYTFGLHYDNGQTPDSLVIGMVPSANLFSGAPVNLSNYLVIDDISFIPNTVPVINGDFESWFDMEYDEPESWYYPMFVFAQPGDTCHPFIQKRDNTTPGDFALQMSSVNRNNQKLALGVSTDNSFFKTAFSGFPVSTRYQTFTGQYQFMADNADTLHLDISFYNQQQYVGNATFTATAATNGFTTFATTINYANNLTPDTASISIFFNDKTLRGNPRALVDKLSLQGYVILDLPALTAADLKVYPNPTRELLTVQLSGVLTNESTIQLYNINGQLQLQQLLPAGQSEINFSVVELPAGIYLMKFVSGTNVLTKKVVVIK